MTELLLLVLLSGPCVEPTDREFRALDLAPMWVRYELYNAAIRLGLVCPQLENYWQDAGCFPEWLFRMRCRANLTPLANDRIYGVKP